MYIDIHVQCLSFLSDFKQNWTPPTNFSVIPHKKFHGNLSSGSHPDICRWKDRRVEVCCLQTCLVKHSKYTTEHLFSHQLQRSAYFRFTSELVLLLHASHEHTDNMRMKGHSCLITIHKDGNSQWFRTCNICDSGKTSLITWLWSQTLLKHFLDKPVASHTTIRLNTAQHFITALFNFIQNVPQVLKEKSAYSEFGIRTI